MIIELVKRIVPPEDILSDEDIADIMQAREEFAKGETISIDDIDWN